MPTRAQPGQIGLRVADGIAGCGLVQQPVRGQPRRRQKRAEEQPAGGRDHGELQRVLEALPQVGQRGSDDAEIETDHLPPAM